MQLLSLFTGYGGLDMAVRALTGADLVGVSDIAAGACTVLARNHPDVPNLGDITGLDTTGLPGFDTVWRVSVPTVFHSRHPPRCERPAPPVAACGPDRRVA